MKKSLLIMSLVALLGSAGCGNNSTSSSNKSSGTTPSSSEVKNTSSEKVSSETPSTPTPSSTVTPSTPSSTVTPSTPSSTVTPSTPAPSTSTPAPVIEKYTVSGTVRNVFDGNIEGVKVYANGNEVTQTDSNGNYTVNEIDGSASSYTLSFVKDGYDTYVKDVVSLFNNSDASLTVDVDLAKTYAKIGSLVSKEWANYEAFTGYVSRNSYGVLVRLASDNIVFTSAGRDSKAEIYFSVGETANERNENNFGVIILSNKTYTVTNFGGLDTSNYGVKVNVDDSNAKTVIDVNFSYESLGITIQDIFGVTFGLWSEVDKDWAPMHSLNTTNLAAVENPTAYVRCDKDNYCFESTVNDYPKEPEYSKDELIAGRKYNVANPTNVGNANGDDMYLNVIKNESSFTFDMVGFGTFADDEYIKIVLHTSDVDGAGWALQESDVSFLVSKDKAYRKTGITDFWQFEKFSQGGEVANHSLVHNAYESGYFTMTFDVDFVEIPEYSATGEVSFFMFEFGAPGIYNAAPWNKAMLVDGSPCGDPALQSCYQIIQEKEFGFDKETLIANYNIKFSHNLYANFVRGEYALTLNLLSFTALSSNHFVRLIIDTDGVAATGGWALDASDVSIVIYKDASYLETGKTNFWDGEANSFHGTNTTLNELKYEENENGYWTISLDIDYSELGLNVNKDSALKGLLLLFAPEIQNGGFSYNGVTDVGDQALQSNYFTI